ncbi:MAG: GntR family transcriptional regulator, partial [Nocardioides sp.]
LRAAIQSGTYTSGSVLPRQRDLAAERGVSTSVIRQAVAVLEAEGILRPTRRRGTVVRERPVQLALARYSGSLSAEATHGPWEATLAAQGLDGRTELVQVSRESADDALAVACDLPVGAPVVHRRRHMWLGNRIVQLQDSWLPADLVDGTPLSQGSKVQGGTYATLAAHGMPPSHVTEVISARGATTAEADLMQSTTASPVIVVERTTRSATRPLEFLRTVAFAESVRISYEDLPLLPS